MPRLTVGANTCLDEFILRGKRLIISSKQS